MLERNANFNNFSIDIILKIFSYLPTDVLLRIALTNKKFNSAVNSILSKKPHRDLNNASHTAVTFDSLPKDMMEAIFSYFSLEMLNNFAVVNKTHNLITKKSDVWKNKLSIHFPSFFVRDNDDCYAKFKNAYTKEYRNLNRKMKRIFTLVKEGQIQELKAEKLNYEDLKLTDINGVDLLTWARNNDCQAVLDYFYQDIILPYYKNRKYTELDQINYFAYGIDPIEEDQEKLSEYKILCRQPEIFDEQESGNDEFDEQESGNDEFDEQEIQMTTSQENLYTKQSPGKR